MTQLRVRNPEYAEQRLFDKDGSNGAQFSLRNNFKGWNGEQEANEDELAKLDEVLKSIGGVV